MEEAAQRNKEDFQVLLSKLQESGKKLVAVREQIESQRVLLDTQSMELASKTTEFASVAESSQPLNVNLEENKKTLQASKDLISISEQLALKCEELVEMQKLFEEQANELYDMQNQQPPEPISDTSQENAVEPVDELDGLICPEKLQFLQRDVISKSLRATFDFVLNLVLEKLREGGMLEDSVMKVLFLLLGELVKVQPKVKPQLELKVTELANLLKGNIRIHAPNSSLKALAFLVFLVADSLEKLINREETVLLASSIAQNEQAPTLFDSLGLSLEKIPETVHQLIKQRRYLLAVWCVCHFRLRRPFIPSELLPAEMTALESDIRTIGSDQAKEKYSRRLNAMLELRQEYDIQAGAPVDVVVKLMAPHLQVNLDI